MGCIFQRPALVGVILHVACMYRALFFILTGRYYHFPRKLFGDME